VGEDVSPPKPRPNELLDYFAERGITFGWAGIDDEEAREDVLAGIEFANDPAGLTLLIPADLREGSALEIFEGGATFAMIVPSGEIYCISGAESGVEECTPSDLPVSG
jgi:hypothetical protein